MLAESGLCYQHAVQRGDYNRYVGNLFGKYDNVRLYWEDQLTRKMLRPHLAELVQQRRSQGRRIRIVDLGCGAGQGYDLLTRISQNEQDLSLAHHRVLEEQDIECYLGLDINPAMVEKGSELYADVPHVHFRQADLREGLPIEQVGEEPYDLYFSSYASLSHLDRPHLQRLLAEIARHGRPGSLVVMDLLGRNSVEWPCYWAARSDAEKFQDYTMNYLADPQVDGDEGAVVEHFPMRYWNGQEVRALGEEVTRRTGRGLQVVGLFDRSILVGRHVDTRQYNPRLKPLRRAVNRLHEDCMRTDLEELIIPDGSWPTHPEPAVDAFLNELARSWNALVRFCQQRLQTRLSLGELEGWDEFSAPLQLALVTMDRVISSAEGLWHSDPRANIIEPQLGFALRSLEFGLQKGMGCGHGLVAILRLT